MKSYHQLKQEEKKASKPQSSGTGSSKPSPGTLEYELKGIGWNMRGVLQKLDELNASMHVVANTLEEIKRKLDEK